MVKKPVWDPFSGTQERPKTPKSATKTIFSKPKSTPSKRTLIKNKSRRNTILQKQASDQGPIINLVDNQPIEYDRMEVISVSNQSNSKAARKAKRKKILEERKLMKQQELAEKNKQKKQQQKLKHMNYTTQVQLAKKQYAQQLVRQNMAESNNQFIALQPGPSKSITNINVTNLNVNNNFNQKTSWNPENSKLRSIVIDGSNVACSHSGKKGKKTFSCRGLKLAVDYFQSRGHEDIKIILPAHREYEQCKNHIPTVDYEVLKELNRKGFVDFCPSRANYNPNSSGSHYDDLFMLALAERNNGVVVSNDHYKDVHKNCCLNSSRPGLVKGLNVCYT